MTGKKRWLARAAVVAAAVAACSALAAASPQQSGAVAAVEVVVFSDNMENGINGWTTSRNGNGGAVCAAADEWHQIDGDGHSPTHSWTNNPYQPSGVNAGSGEYCEQHLTSPAILTPLGFSALFLVFWEKHFTEGGEPVPGVPVCNAPGGTPPCDFGIVQISRNNGGSYTPLPHPDFPHRFEGGDPVQATPAGTWNRILFQLGPGDFTPGETLRIRFTFNSDALVASPPTGPFAGWYIDDVSLATAPPTSVGISSFAAKATGRKVVTVTWRTGSEAEVLGFNVWRHSGTKKVKVNRALIPAKAVALGAGAAYRVVDRTVRSKVRYTYRLEVVHTNGKRSRPVHTTVQAR
jgi:hypothetical protein